MDRNQATGLILFALVLLAYSYFFAVAPEPIAQEASEDKTSLTINNNDDSVKESSLPIQELDSLQDVQAQSKYGAFAALTRGEVKEVILENDKFTIHFSTKGAEIKKVVLKEFKTWDGRPLVILDEEHSLINYQIPTDNGLISINDFFFTPDLQNIEKEGKNLQQLTFTSEGNGAIQRIYTIEDGTYVVDKVINFGGLTENIKDNSLQILWEDQLVKQEADIEESRRKTNINFYTTAGEHDDLSLTSTSVNEEVSEPMKWMSFSQRFFTAAIIAEKEFSKGAFQQETPTDTFSVKNVKADLALKLESGKAEFSYYFGPNNYNILKKVTPGFDKNVDMGYFFVSWVNKYIIVNLFQWLEKYISNYGIIIILIVFIIKLALFPLTYKSYIGMAKMRVIKPEIDELKEKYKDDPTKQQQEQLKLFGQLGVSPVAGCLPMLLQMPFLFAMFFFFPNSIELRQESFLWAHDLSTYDSILKLPFTIPFYGAHVSLFTLLMTISQIAYTKFNNQLTAASGPMKNLGYIMPVMFMFVLNSYPAALGFYYFVSNMVTFGQQALIKLFVDDKKIREKVEQTKIKNATKKKSKFQTKLEEAMKVAEETKKSKK
jgi:YidC/Oxa1 family membrane protein insertase